jgi:hypothetical protein
VKPTVDREATRRVLADIDDAVRPVERARTAAAVERVLDSAVSASGITPHGACGDRSCPCVEDAILRDSLGDWFRPLSKAEFRDAVWQRGYAPWDISPHLFPEAQ